MFKITFKIIFSIIFLGLQIAPLLGMREAGKGVEAKKSQRVEKVSTVEKLSLGEVDLQLLVSLQVAISNKLDLEKIEKVFTEECHRGADIKKVLNFELYNGAMLPFAISYGCNLEIIKYLRSQGAGFNEITHQKPTLENVIFSNKYPEEERTAFVEWLVEEDTYVPGVTVKDSLRILDDEKITVFINNMLERARSEHRRGSDSNAEDNFRTRLTMTIPFLFYDKQNKKETRSGLGEEALIEALILS